MNLMRATQFTNKNKSSMAIPVEKNSSPRSGLEKNIKFFLWQLSHECIPSFDFLLSHHVGQSSICGVRSKTLEDTFFSCDVASTIWMRLHVGLTPPQRSVLKLYSFYCAVNMVSQVSSLTCAFLGADMHNGETQLVRCLHAQTGQVVVHVDDSALKCSGPAGYGGICRDINGRGFFVFMVML
ncbi:hypothetical protein VNO78_22796 [Psophocarpus tetragonolobus]|uniref:Uncharacterized protein n=1 Tax=Psophocarpus tetragonolobus TaxID=3891 RepID=A0AAN9S2Z5_PSOTE